MCDDAVAGCKGGGATEAAGLFGVGHALNGIAVERGVGGDYAVHAVALQGGGNDVDLCFIQIWGNLDKDGHAAALLRGQLFTALRNGTEQAVQRLVALQGAQVFGVGRADVHRHVVSVRVHTFQTGQVVAGGVFNGGGCVLANVQAQQHGLALRPHGRLPDVGDEGIEPVVVKAQPVDQALGSRDAEHAGLGVARLALGGDGAHFNKTKAHGSQRINAAGVLVQPRGHAHTVGELQARQCDGVVHQRCRPGQLQRCALAFGKGVHGEVVGLFRVHTKEKGANEGVRDKRHKE